MSDELRAAAERIVNATRYWTGNVAVGPGTLDIDERDVMRVANAYVAEHPADDGEAVMPDWLESLGYADSMGMLYEKRYELCDSVRIMFFAREHPQRWASAIWVGGGKCHVKENPTRRDVRRLLAALGITP